jgi:hypothetical protein
MEVARRLFSNFHKKAKRLANVKFSVWCLHCASPHVIAGKEASVIIMRAEELPVRDFLDTSATHPEKRV